MRLLLLTDTHGDLDPINELALRHKADACIHCGDFGFYDQASVERLPLRELQLRLKHSHLPREVRKRAFRMSPDELRSTIDQAGLLAGFQPYLDGTANFVVPVCVVSGNHEDPAVVQSLRSGERQVQNLTLLDEQTWVGPAPWIEIFGLGGNFYLDDSEALFAPPGKRTESRRGQVRTSFTEFAHLLDLGRDIARNHQRSGTRPLRIFVSHVSPGKARLLERFSLVFGADLVVSGHMDPPLSHAYSLFSVAEPDEALARSEHDLTSLCRRWQKFDGNLDGEDQRAVEDAIKALSIPPFPRRERGSRAAPGSIEERFFSTQFINLADAPAGWSLLDVDKKGVTLVQSSRWTRPPHLAPR